MGKSPYNRFHQDTNFIIIRFLLRAAIERLTSTMLECFNISLLILGELENRTFSDDYSG